MTTPQPPAKRPGALPGIVVLTADQAIRAIERGDHPEAGQGSPSMDAGLIELLRSGHLIGMRLPDGRLAFALAPATN